MNVPVIGFDPRGVQDLITNNYNGILINEGLTINESVDLFKNIIINVFNQLEILEELKSPTFRMKELYSRINFIQESISNYNTYKFVQSYENNT